MQCRLIFLLLLGQLSVTALCSQGGRIQSAADSSQTVVPGAQYDASWLHRLLLGSNWRDLWMTPVAAEVLDLRHFAGGLSPVKRGGGAQTRSVRLKGNNG